MVSTCGPARSPFQRKRSPLHFSVLLSWIAIKRNPQIHKHIRPHWEVLFSLSLGAAVKAIFNSCQFAGRRPAVTTRIPLAGSSTAAGAEGHADTPVLSAWLSAGFSHESRLVRQQQLSDGGCWQGVVPDQWVCPDTCAEPRAKRWPQSLPQTPAWRTTVVGGNSCMD